MNPSAFLRLVAFGFSALLFGIAAVMGYFSHEAYDLLMSGFRQNRTLISSDPIMLTGLVIVLIASSLAILFLFAKKPDPGGQAKASPTAIKWTGRYLIGLVVLIVAAVIAPFIQYPIVDHYARQRGYVPCPKPTWPRHQNDRWALPGPHGATERCPGEGTDANL